MSLKSGLSLAQRTIWSKLLLFSGKLKWRCFPIELSVSSTSAWWITIVSKFTLKSHSKEGQKLSCNRIAYVNSVSFRLSIGFISFHYWRRLQHQGSTLFHADGSKILSHCYNKLILLFISEKVKECHEIHSGMSHLKNWALGHFLFHQLTYKTPCMHRVYIF